jgi:DNA-binding MarR family transcriptional regulator
MARTVTVKKIRSPAPGNLNDDIDFISKSFGYFSRRDKQDSAGRIFRLLVKKAGGLKEGVSSEEIAQELSLSRGATVYHLNKFIESGLVTKERNVYRIRAGSLQKSVEEVKEDIDRIFSHIAKIAMDIDEKLGHYYR